MSSPQAAAHAPTIVPSSSAGGAPGHCPHCGALVSPGQMLCSSCGAPLAAGAPVSVLPSARATGQLVPAASDGSYVAVWGPRSCGKTMYLYMLQDHVLKMPGREWQMRPENEEAKEFLNRAARTLGKHQYLSLIHI